MVCKIQVRMCKIKKNEKKNERKIFKYNCSCRN